MTMTAAADAELTDLEMTKLCARAMGSDFYIENGEVFLRQPPAVPVMSWPLYDPLHDDAQAMALVKRFDLSICPRRYDEQGRHTLILHQGEGDAYRSYCHADADLNRAIVECVAKMQRQVTPSR